MVQKNSAYAGLISFRPKGSAWAGWPARSLTHRVNANLRVLPGTAKHSSNEWYYFLFLKVSAACLPVETERRQVGSLPTPKHSKSVRVQLPVRLLLLLY